MNAKEQGYIPVNGIKLYYEIFGAGKNLTLIHGGGSSGFYDFEETIRRLSSSFRLIVIDLQNHGRSDHREIPETFEQDAQDVVAVLNELGVTHSYFWGFSNGATTVLKIAHLFPLITEKIVIASGVTKRSGMVDGFFDGMQHATIDHMPEYLKKNFYKLILMKNYCSICFIKIISA